MGSGVQSTVAEAIFFSRVASSTGKWGLMVPAFRVCTWKIWLHYMATWCLSKRPGGKAM